MECGKILSNVTQIEYSVMKKKDESNGLAKTVQNNSQMLLINIPKNEKKAFQYNHQLFIHYWFDFKISRCVQSKKKEENKDFDISL